MKTFVKFKRITITGTILMALFSLLILHGEGYGDNGSILPMPTSEYAEFLDTAAVLTKQNYGNIRTWQGEMNIEENNYFIGEECRLLKIDAKDPAVHSDNIRRSVSATVKFATDIQNNKLYTKLMPVVKYTSVDLNRDIDVKERYSPVISIVTSDEYLSCQPDHSYSYDRKTVKNGKWVGRNAFRLPLEKVKGEQWGHVRDPRKYFFSGNKTIWELLFTLRDLIVSPPSDIPEGKFPQIDISTEEKGDHTLTYIKSRFYASSACTNDEDLFINAIMTLDSSVNLNLVRREVTDKTGKTLQTLDITYEKISNVYVPKTVHFRIFRPSDQNLTFDSQITFIKSILNVSISEETFGYRNLGLKNDDRFIDKVASKEFEYKDDKLVELAKKSAE